MKSYTDIKQSKVLSKILPLESADAFYPWRELMKDYDSIYVPEKMMISDLEEEDICAWSLAALLSVLPNENMLVKTTDGEYYCLAKDAMTKHYDNPVDACVDMIEKLYELKML